MKRKPKIETCRHSIDRASVYGGIKGVYSMCAWGMVYQTPHDMDVVATDKTHCKQCKCWEPKEDGK